MSRFVDPRAPVALADSQVNSLKTNPRIMEYRAFRDSLSKTLRDTYGTIQKAKGTKLHELYREADLRLKNEKNKLCSSAKREFRKQFFDTVDTKEVNEQLNLSLLDLDQKDWKPEMVEHEIVERKQIADLFCY